MPSENLPLGERVGHSSPQQSWGVFWHVLINKCKVLTDRGCFSFQKSKESKQSKANANHVEEDVGDGGVTSRDIGLVDFVGNGNKQSDPSGEKKIGYWVAWVTWVKF